MSELQPNPSPDEQPAATMGVDEIFDQLAKAHDPLTSIAFVELMRLSETQRQAVFEKVDLGVELPSAITTIIAIAGPYKMLAAARWADESIFANDDLFSMTRFILTVDKVDGRDLSTERWVAATTQIRRLPLNGQLPAVRGLLFLIWHALQRGDKEFAMFFAAHTTFDLKSMLLAALIHGRELGEAVDMLWPEIEVERNRLAREVWLKGYISVAEHDAVTGMQDSMLQILYPQVWTGGYQGFVMVVNNETV